MSATSVWSTSNDGTEVLLVADRRVAGVVVWWWREALDSARDACPACGASPCWRHVAPGVTLEGDDDDAPPLAIGIANCVAGFACEPDATGTRPQGVAAVSIDRNGPAKYRGFAVCSVCVACLESIGIEPA